MLKVIVRVLVLLTVIALVALMTPCAAPIAIGEEANYPTYQPVTLESVMPIHIDYDAKTPYEPHPEAFLPDNTGYLDSTLSIRVETFRAYDTTCMATWVQIASPTQLRTRLCKAYPSKATARVDVMAKQAKAVLAINGDYFIYHNAGYVARNGTVLRKRFDEGFDTLIIDDAGDFTILRNNTEEQIQAFDGNIIQALTFGPGLVVDGVMTTDFPLLINVPTHETQRIALAQMDTLSYLIVTTEGPENKGSTGLTMYEFAQLLYDLGAKNAYNLDGGSSSSLVLNYKKINSLSTGKIRAVGDIIYFITAEE